jgi:hypothetical protein
MNATIQFLILGSIGLITLGSIARYFWSKQAPFNWAFPVIVAVLWGILLFGLTTIPASFSQPSIIVGAIVGLGGFLAGLPLLYFFYSKKHWGKSNS